MAAVLDAAGQGHGSVVVVRGEAGVGKTALVREAVTRRHRDTALLDGRCLPLQALTVPLLPLRSALRSSTLPGADVCLAALNQIDQAPRALEAWLDTLTAATPVLLVVDDLQWSDQSTLDVLMYLVAGLEGRRLTVWATLREEDLPESHGLGRWLRNIQRLPTVAELRLDPLDRAGTEAQLADLLGGMPHQSLVQEVFDQARGNPYLNQLLASGLTPAARGLPPALPGDLTSAVRLEWHGLSEPARTMTSLLAVAGRPETPEGLEEVARRLHLHPGPEWLAEAVAHGTVERLDGDRYWFRHPLQAEVLAGALAPGQRRRWHSAFAEQLQASLPEGTAPSLEAALALADHHARADHPEAARAWASAAWD
ncbi:MAG: hypothetical protein JWP61_345, partial [Friedmanniella sp.]|nr:hypothetical protein [Friedmanniella sp.]